MSAFASQTFDSARYLACRPIYPKHFYNLIYDFHHRTSPLFSSNTSSPPSSSSSTAHGSTRWSKAVDLGCGPGFIAQTLSSRFDAVLGVDPSQKMIDVGLQPEEEGGSRKKTIEYRVGSGEDLSWLGDGEVDLVVVGQAAHWFDMGKVWKELGRVVGKGGSVALIGYAEMTLPKYPSLQHLIASYSNGPSNLGPYWQQPGRKIVEDCLDALPFPSPPQPAVLPSLTPPSFPPSSPVSPEPTLASPLSPAPTPWDASTFLRLQTDSSGERLGIRKTMSWDQLKGYWQTWSSWHKYGEEHGKEAADELLETNLERLREAVEKEGGGERGEVEIFWPSVIMLAGKEK